MPTNEEEQGDELTGEAAEKFTTAPGDGEYSPPAEEAQRGDGADFADSIAALDSVDARDHYPNGEPTPGEAGGSLGTATAGQLAVRVKRLGKEAGANLSQHPEYKAIVGELKKRGIKSFGALEKAAREGK